jgi:hypothetical protein
MSTYFDTIQYNKGFIHTTGFGVTAIVLSKIVFRSSLKKIEDNINK